MRNPKILVLDRESGLSDQVRSVANELRPRPEVVSWERISAVDEVVAGEGPFEVVVAGPSLGTKAGLSRLQAVHDELPSMSMVLAFSKRPDAQLRDIVRTGAIDLLQLPVADRSLHDAIERAVSLSRSSVTAKEPELAHVAGAPTGSVFTVASATGGCGKTFLATNLAYFLHHNTGKRTCIVDLDLQFGEVSTALRLRPKYTISDALAREEADEVDLKGHIEEYMVTHDTGVQVLAAPRDPSDADRILPPDVSRIIEAARANFDYVVVDTPAQLSEIVLAAFDQSNELFVLATLDLPSVRNMGVFLNTLDKLKIPSDDVKLILNKAEKDVGIDIDQITRLFPQGFTAVLPYAPEVSKSVNVGTPILAFNPASQVSTRLTGGLVHVLPEGLQPQFTQSEANSKKRSSIFARMFKSLRPSES